jgi:ribosome-binding factor A
MTMSHRVERFSSTLKHCLADILINEINNPKLKPVVIAEVIVAHDLKKAKIFVAAAVGDVDEIIMHLTKAKGFIKRALAKRMYLKYVPELVFLKDETTEAGNGEGT